MGFLAKLNTRTAARIYVRAYQEHLEVAQSYRTGMSPLDLSELHVASAKAASRAVNKAMRISPPDSLMWYWELESLERFGATLELDYQSSVKALIEPAWVARFDQTFRVNHSSVTVARALGQVELDDQRVWAWAFMRSTYDANSAVSVMLSTPLEQLLRGSLSRRAEHWELRTGMSPTEMGDQIRRMYAEGHHPVYVADRMYQWKHQRAADRQRSSH